MTHNDPSEKTAQLAGDPSVLIDEMERAQYEPPKLIIVRGNPPGQTFQLLKPENIVGRDPGCDVYVPEPAVSRKHAIIRVEQEGKRAILTDCGSQNGTKINGQKLPVNSDHELKSEELIQVGSTIFKFLPRGQLESLYVGKMGDDSTKDPLTGISNKRFLLARLQSEFNRARALSQDFSLIFFDIDHFKKINDTFGHDAGDSVLKGLGILISANFVRVHDIFARYGGEEFILVLPNTKLEDAARIAELIRTRIEGHVFAYGGKRVPVTSSFGVAELTAEIDTPERLLKTADEALYTSKQTGRNKVTTKR